MYLLAHVGFATVVVGRGVDVDVIGALVVAALHVRSSHSVNVHTQAEEIQGSSADTQGSFAMI